MFNIHYLEWYQRQIFVSVWKQKQTTKTVYKNESKLQVNDADNADDDNDVIQGDIGFSFFFVVVVLLWWMFIWINPIHQDDIIK